MTVPDGLSGNKPEKKVPGSPVNAEVTDDEPVLYKYITPQTKASGRLIFEGSLNLRVHRRVHRVAS
jgi:hypothetical protein